MIINYILYNIIIYYIIKIKLLIIYVWMNQSLKFINKIIKYMNFFFTYNMSKLLNSPISGGIVPVNWLLLKSLFF